MILVDAHVHIHDCFDLEDFLDAALTNFRAESIRCGRRNAFTALLLLTESEQENWFDRLVHYARNGYTLAKVASRTWSFRRTAESCSLLAECNGAQAFYIVAGRQIVTAEGLEVLALITDRQFANGQVLAEVIESVKAAGAIPAIPWGWGKWMGKRGRLLKRVLEDSKHPGVFLGDNSGRPQFLPRPSHFSLAESRGIRILPGSDPLPFVSECSRAGSFGFSLEGAVPFGQPAGNLRRMLTGSDNNIRTYGQLESPLRFFRNQLAMQLEKRLRNGDR